MIGIGTLDFTHLIQETVKHLLHVSYLFIVNILVSSQNWQMVMLSADGKTDLLDFDKFNKLDFQLHIQYQLLWLSFPPSLLKIHISLKFAV